jgi:hypothetical protein
MESPVNAWMAPDPETTSPPKFRADARPGRRRLPPRTRTLAAALVIAAASGCASSEALSTEGQALQATDSRIITLAEVLTVRGTNAFEVVARLHPNWLIGAGARARSTRLPSEIVVVTEGQYFGPPASLRLIPIEAVGSIRYMTGTDATNQFPWLASGRHVEAAIVVTHRGAHR